MISLLPFASLWPLGQARAVALPPRTVDRAYDFQKDIRSLPAVRAQGVAILSKDPVLNSAFRIEGSKLVRLSNDGEHLMELETRGGSWSSLRETSVDRIWKGTSLNSKALRHSAGVFVLNGSRLDYKGSSKDDRTYWSIDLGREPVRVDSQDGALVAWQIYPPKLFYLPSSLGSFYQLQWSPDAEPVGFFVCDRRRAAVVENMPGGLSRIVFLKDALEPVAYTVFDFSGQERKSDTLAADTSDCENFYVAGPFGTLRVRYNRGTIPWTRGR